MDPLSRAVRKTLLDILSTLAEVDRQRAYEASVPIAHVPAELFCGWFDGCYRPGSPEFDRAFSPSELAALATFNRVFAEVADGMEPLPASVEGLLARPAWARVTGAAAIALRAMDRGPA